MAVLLVMVLNAPTLMVLVLVEGVSLQQEQALQYFSLMINANQLSLF
jgi:hypothetical protein